MTRVSRKDVVLSPEDAGDEALRPVASLPRRRSGRSSRAKRDYGIEAAGDERRRLDSIRFLEEMWGDGFLSPGSLEEVERLLCGRFGAAIKSSPAHVLRPAARAR